MAELAAAVRSARHLVIYTGAGISTVRAAAPGPAGLLWSQNSACGTSPAVSRLQPGSFLLPRRSCGCRIAQAQPEPEDTALASLESLPRLGVKPQTS